MIAFLYLLSLYQAPVAADVAGPLQFTHLSSREGLSQNTVLCMTGDSQGFLWLGTQDGLNRYDGYDFRVFRPEPENPHAIADRYIRCLYADLDGSLWIGTRGGGLNHYKPETGRFEAFHISTEARGEHEIWAVTSDGRGGLWVGTRFGGLWHFNGKGFRKMQGDAVWVQQLVVDQRGHLWIGSAEGLFQIASNSDSMQVVQADGLPHQLNILCLALDNTDALWIGTRGQGLYRLGEDVVRYGVSEEPQRHLVSDWISCLFTTDEAVWVGTGQGLWRIQPDTAPQLSRHEPTRPDSLANNRTRALFRDRSGVLWVGTNKGVSRWHPIQQRFRVFTHLPGDSGSLSDNNVTAVVEDERGRLWIGSDAGLNRLQPGEDRFQRFTQRGDDPQGQIDSGVLSLHTSGSDLWVGTFRGLTRVDTSTNATVHMLQDKRIYALAETADNRFWAGVYGEGLFVRNGDAFKPVSDKPRQIHCLLPDTSGGLWVGDTAGLMVLRGETVHLVDKNKAVLAMLYDRQGTLWIGASNGLAVHREGRLQPYDALDNQVIQALALDASGTLWLGTNTGICRLNPLDGSLTRFAREDGLPGDECNTGAVLAASDGRLYFGGIDGLVTFAPRDFVTNPNPPTVAVTSFVRLVDGVPQEIPLAPEPRLSYRDRVLQFSVAALDFTVPEKNAYAYRLKADDPWVPLGRERQVTFTDLAPGRYRFQARGSNNDGVWHETGVTLPFVIEPPWWQTPLAYLVYVVLGTALAAGFYLRLIAINRLLERKVADRTKALEASNQQIVRTQEQLVMREKMASLGVLTAGMAHEINNPNNFAHNSAVLMQQDLSAFRSFIEELGGDEEDAPILDALNRRLDRLTQSGDLILNGTTRIKNIVSDLKNFTYQDQDNKVNAKPGEGLQSTVNLIRSRYKDVAITCTLADNPELVCHPARLNQVFLNLAMNACQAVEGQEERRLTIESKVVADELVISFKDNGPGMSPEVCDRVFQPFFTTRKVGEGSGLGLSISYGIVEEHGGRIEVVSKLGEGSTFTVVLPVSV